MLSREAGFPESARRVFGHYVRFMREHGARYTLDDPRCAARIEEDFRAWLSAHHGEDLAAASGDEPRAAA